MRRLGFELKDEVAEEKDRIVLEWKLLFKEEITWERIMEFGVEDLRRRFEEKKAA
ncbi:hypothetical protein CCP3SC15_300002 [Gammaproteobacteria bacterium]